MLWPGRFAWQAKKPYHRESVETRYMTETKLSWDDFLGAVDVLAGRLRPLCESAGWAIFGEPRGGLPLAVALSHALKLPLVDQITPKVIWVDDTVMSGETLRYRLNDPARQEMLLVCWVDGNHTFKTLHSVLSGKRTEKYFFPWETPHYEGQRFAIESIQSRTQVKGGQLGLAQVCVKLLSHAVTGPARYTPEELALYIAKNYPNHNWVRLVDGDRHTLKPVVAALHGRKLKAALESRGSGNGYIRAGLDWITIILERSRHVRPAALAMADEIRIEIRDAEDLKFLESTLSGITLKSSAAVFLYPKALFNRCRDLAIKNNWRIETRERLDKRGRMDRSISEGTNSSN